MMDTWKGERHCVDDDPIEDNDRWRKNHPEASPMALQIRYLRIRNEMQVQELAKAVGISRGIIQNIEAGMKKAKCKQGYEILKYFYRTDYFYRQAVNRKYYAQQGRHLWGGV